MTHRFVAIALAATTLAAQQRTETFWQRAMRVLGVSATPGSLRGTGGDFEGQIWVASTSAKPVSRAVSGGTDFRSPIFTSDGKALLALQRNTLVRVSTESGDAAPVRTLTGVEKLVGVSQDDPDQILTITSGAPVFLSLSTGRQVAIPYNPDLKDDLALLNHLRGWDREYGDARVYVRSERKAALGGDVEWSDIYWKRGTAAPVNLSTCDGVKCGQPSLSSDGSRVAYIRASQP